jgi:hypothetical protein
VQRDVQGADRVDHRAAPAVHRRADVQPLPDRLDVERVGADQQLAQAEAHVVGPRRLDARARDPRVQIGLADSRDALVGVDLDDDVVLRRARGGGVERRLDQDVAVDCGYLQLGSFPLAQARTAERMSC